ncbi:helix-turn-helix transcriptional regulator, partial [Photobacterium damselae]|uniref:helix-turn-helix transcriptional regulator n=1 Tax=Photobacterium damselae TaxID=38293 RepID=UPI00406950B6
MTFSGALIQLRKQSKITQIDMAKNLGVARQTYLDLESGKVEPRYSTLVKLGELFNVSVVTFF